jgi:hypothetical protein
MMDDQRDELLLATAAAVAQLMAGSHGRPDEKGWIEADYKSAQRRLEAAIKRGTPRDFLPKRPR